MIQLNSIVLLIFTFNVISSDITNTTNNNNNNISNLTENLSENFLYICGGFDGSKPLSDCYKYNKHTNVWQSIRSMSTIRRDFGLVSLNSILYAMGGWNNGGVLNSVETYDTQTNRWKSVSSMNILRDYFDAAVISNTIYVCGGYNDNYFKSCEYYSQNIDKWYLTTPMSIERQSLGLVSLGEGFLYAIGGVNRNGYLNSMEMFDTKTKQWIPKASMIYKRGHYGSASFMDKIYVCGGYGNSDGKSCESYDPQTNQWTPIASMKNQRSHFKLIAFDDNLYALGGYADADGTRFNSVELYDHYTNQWYYTTSLPHIVTNYAITVL